MDVTTRHAKCFGEKFEQVLVGLAVDRRGGDTDFQVFTLRANNFVLAGTWLGLYMQQQRVTLPLIEGFVFQLKSQYGACRVGQVSAPVQQGVNEQHDEQVDENNGSHGR